MANVGEKLIKFRCVHCGQKLGVPNQHAGRLVKCATCARPTQVPNSPSPNQDAIVPLKELEGTPPVMPPRASMPRQLTCPKCGARNAGDTEFCTLCWHRLIAETPAGVRPKPDQPSSRVMLGLLVALGFSVAASMLWAGLVYFVSLSWLGFLAAAVCALAGVGYTLVSKERGAKIGLMVGCIGLCGILVGKVLIAYFVVMPELAQIRGLESLGTTELSEEEIEEIMQDDNRMFSVACRHVARQEQWDDDHQFHVSLAHDWGMKDMKVSEEQEAEINASIAHVKEILAGWTDLQKSAAIQADWAISQTEMKEFGKSLARLMIELAKESKDPQGKEIAEGLERSLAEAEKEEQRAAKSESQPADGAIPSEVVRMLEFVEGTRSLAETPVAWPVALMGSFSLLDLLWFPLGLWTAFKAGAGRA